MDDSNKDIPAATNSNPDMSNFEKMLAKFRGQKENVARAAQLAMSNRFGYETPMQRIKRVKDQKERARKHKAEKAARKRQRR